MQFFSWSRFFSNLPKLLKTLPVTLEVVVVAYSLGLVLAVLLACLRIRKIPVLNQLAVIFISFERDTPLLVQMLVSYYGLPLLFSSLLDISTRGWPRIIFVYIAYTANVAAFLSEVFRSAILSIPQGQKDAALACGLTGRQSFLVKSTSYVYMIGVVDIIGRAQAIGSATSHSLESYIIVALVFVTLSLLLQLPYGFVEKKLSFYTRQKEEKHDL